jgi:signal transduction histidine kinase
LRHSAAVLPLAAAAALLLLGVSETAYRSASTSLSELEERDAARRHVLSVRVGLIDAETGQRGYLLTGRKEYLQPYEAGVQEVRTNLGALKVQYQDDAKARPIAADLAKRSEEALSVLEATIRMYDDGKPEAWRDLVSSNIGKEKMDAVLETVGLLADIESTRIAQGRDQVVATLMLSRIGIGALTAFSVLAFFMYLRQTAAVESVRTRLAVEVEAERDRLETEVARRTAELTELTRHLQTAREDERHHLARELHDELGALLTAAKLDAARLKRMLGAPPAGVQERLTHLGTLLDSGIALKRRIIEDLRPSSLSNLGLVAALQIQANEFAKRIDANVTAELEAVDLPDSAQIAVYRLVQESLTNIAKYAAASQVTVRMQHRGANIVVSVIDNGKGFDMATSQASTHGLIGMRYRIESQGGRLRVTSRPGEGTLVEATLPAVPLAA